MRNPEIYVLNKHVIAVQLLKIIAQLYIST